MGSRAGSFNAHDEYEALKDFTHEYEGSPTLTEQLRLEYQKLEETYPGLAEKLRSLPRRVFSGKEHPTPGSKAVFFCYILPAPDLSKKTQESEELQWTEAAGRTAWYLFDIDSQMVSDTPDAMPRSSGHTGHSQTTSCPGSEAFRDTYRSRETHQEHVSTTGAGSGWSQTDSQGVDGVELGRKAVNGSHSR